MDLTQNEINVLEELKSGKGFFLTSETLKLVVTPSEEYEVRNTIYSLMEKGVPIRDVGLEKGGWKLDSPRFLIYDQIDTIRKAHERIEKIMRYSIDEYEKSIKESLKLLEDNKRAINRKM
ncbi:hypothetical protein [Rummeliibacillus suwonensis]|uniref:hypothetical protein n=1 Tax=Rummeliibacillus suwonensis TaxID=1306154 RepID=UPI0011B7C8D0|nr:hypothetical protein [Rummeliibacillus suwonensis]